MILEYFYLIAGIILLIKGADWLVDGSSILAKKLGMSSLIIGLTVVAFGTSLPELIVTLFASTKGSEQIILGNILGSNISNLLLIIGTLAVIAPIRISKSAIKIDVFYSIIAIFALLTTAVLFSQLNLFFSSVFLIFFSIFIYFTFKYTKKAPIIRTKKDIPFLIKIISLIVAGSIALFIGGNLTVNGALFISKKLGLSELLISASIIAIGTSLPELITSIKAIFKNKSKLAIGNILGSNIFNIFWVLGLTGLFKTILLPSSILTDILFLLLATLVFLTFCYIGEKYWMTRNKGILLLLLYIIYLTIIFTRG